MVKQSRQQAKFKALLAERAHFMRQNATEEEQILWSCVAGKRLGVSFRRQFVIGRYIVDLVAPAAHLVVEVDGGWHSRRVVADARRDRVLQRLGYRVLRLEADLVRCTDKFSQSGLPPKCLLLPSTGANRKRNQFADLTIAVDCIECLRLGPA